MNRIKDLRQLRNWSQDRLAQELNCTGVTVLRYEQEQRQLTPSVIHRICDLFGCTSDYLLGRSDTPYSQISEDDAKILKAYHALPEESLRLANFILEPYMATPKALKAR